MTGIESNNLQITYNFNDLGQLSVYNDLNNKSTYYYYDDLGRLSVILDNSESILKSYNYYYSRQNDGNYDSNYPNNTWYVSSQKGGLYEPFNSMEKWSVIDGTWSIENGKLKQDDSSDDNTHCYTAIDQSEKMLIEWDVEILNGGGSSSGIHFLADNSNHDLGNNYLIWTYNSSVVIYYHDSNGLHILKTTEGDSSVSFDGTITGHWCVFYDNGTFEVFKDGKRLNAKWVDSTPLTSGKYISLRTNGTRAYFDNIKVILDPIVTTYYFDGLGREIQNQQRDGDKTITIAKEYDAFDRIIKQWKPYINIEDGFTFDNNYVTNAQNYYDGSAGRPDCMENPYTEYAYRDGFTNDILEIGNPSEIYKIGSIHSQRFKYVTNTSSDVEGYPENTLYCIEKRDENRTLTDSFNDKFNNKIADRTFKYSNLTALIPVEVNAEAGLGLSRSASSETDIKFFTVDFDQIVNWECQITKNGVSSANFKIYEEGKEGSPIVSKAYPGSYTGSFKAYTDIKYYISAHAWAKDMDNYYLN